ncbi:MAG: DNA polymerase I [Bacteroidota bacterium]
MSEKKLFLLDGHALVYRAHYAFINRPLINSKGLNVSAVSGFTRYLWDVLKNQNATHIAVAFDLPGPTFRHKMYDPYKANREEQPEDITLAFPYIENIVRAFNIPVVTCAGYEADDVIGTLAKQAEKEGFQVYMVTPDKDYAQLVSQNIFMYKPGRKGGEVEILGEDEVLAKWDIERVDQVIDVLGLQGDAVDNIPGIPGIGPKTAVKLLKQFGDLEGILSHTDQLKGKQRERVEEFAEQGRLSKTLATIDLATPIQFDAEVYRVEEINREEVSQLFKELEFRSLAKTILGTGAEPATAQGNLFGQPEPAKGGKSSRGSDLAAHSIAEANLENTPHEYQLVETPEARRALVEKLARAKVLCFDTETTGIDANQAELVGLAFSIQKGEGFYVPLPADQEAARAIVAEFKGLLEDEAIEKVGQNLKYDMLMMKWYGVEVAGTFFDTMIAHYLCEPDRRHKLDYLAETYLKYQMVPIETLIGKKGKNQLTMRDIEVAKVSDYAAEDADITFQLRDVFQPMLAEINTAELYRDLEAPLIRVLTDMEYEGVRINPDFLNDYSAKLGAQILEKEQQIYKEAGTPFNINSPKQVGEVLFDRMKLPYRWRKTATGQYSTNEAKLSELAVEHPFVQEILHFRKLNKLKSTYVDTLPQLVNPRTGRVHSSFNQARAATGRLSSENPNLQNIPIRDEAGREIRKAFEPRDADHILLAADYSQIELRLIAEISGDEAMLEAFQAGHDIHRATAARVYGKTLEEVTADERRNAKTVNFSIIYGAGATNLSRQLGIKRAEASELIKNYFAQYQGLKNYMDETVAFARTNGYVTTLLGRRRYLRDINSKSGLERSNAERVAINTPIQGSAADMIKVAMIDIHRELQAGNYKTKMILQVHDELVFDVYRPELEKVKPLIEEKMKNALPNLKVPILVGMDTGENWLEAH